MSILQVANDLTFTRDKRWFKRACLAGVMLLCGSACAKVAAPASSSPSVQLSKGGVTMMPIVISSDASEQTRAMADTLAAMLGRMGGTSFTVEIGDGQIGIVLGVASNFPTVVEVEQFTPTDPLRREDYLLRTHAKGLQMIGATDMAVEHAAWDLLRRLGYRQFFPGKTWEVVPPPGDLAIAVDTFERPDFHTRWMWYGHGFWKYNVQPYTEWCARNRATRGFKLSTGHMYQTVIRRRKEVFAEHPEYLALVDGKRKGSKFCIANPDLRAVIVDYVLEGLRNEPGQDCVSLEPSDGGGWCECDDCAALGSISDRALTLANEVARAVWHEFPGTYVGLLAYSMHSPPPTIQVESNVIIKVQTSFIRGGFTVDDLMTGWQARGARIGVGDYYSISFDNSRPAASKGSDLAYIRESIPRFHRQGARFFMAESSDLWGGIGLGHYLAAQLTWDVGEAENADALINDFLTRAFGPASQPMASFFRRIYRFSQEDRRPLIRNDMLARLYRDLAAARELAVEDPGVLARIDDLLLYTHYEELFQRYEAASGDARQAAFERLLRHTWRIRETMMVHAKPMIMHLAKRNRIEQPPKEVYADETPFSEKEKQAILAAGLANYEPIEVGFEPIDFSDDLVPATPLKLPHVADGSYDGGPPVGQQVFYTWRDEGDPTAFDLTVSGGHVVHYRNIASPVQVSLFADANPILDEAVAYDDHVAPDGVERPVRLRSTFTGLHRIKVVAPSNRAKVVVPDMNMPLTLPASLDHYNRLSGYWSLYFYVPRGTTVVGGYLNGTRGRLLDSAGAVRCDFAKLPKTAFFSVTVPEGQDGTLWKIDGCIGRVSLLTVPPWLARNAESLLLPREVVERDSRVDAERE